MNALLEKSINLILANQAPSGAYVACPNFPTYKYCWFRDGSFIAYAMDLAGEKESAFRFHTWAATQVNLREPVVAAAVRKASVHEALTHKDYLHTRYKLDGNDGVEEEWPNFQLDGFGTWLWSLGKQQALGGQPLPAEILKAAGLVAEYLEALWQLPCFDCWEEFPEQLHPYTLAAIFGGLYAHTQLCGTDHSRTLSAIRSTLLERWVKEGHFVKFSGDSIVDANLLGLVTPYRVFEPDDPLVIRTVAQIERELGKQVGVHRYIRDTYYGGGEWILLTAWLGWFYAGSHQKDSREKAIRLQQWIEAQDRPGGLPEQVSEHLNDPSYLPIWQKRWGPVALPLLWSHAKYIILSKSLES